MFSFLFASFALLRLLCFDLHLRNDEGFDLSVIDHIFQLFGAERSHAGDGDKKNPPISVMGCDLFDLYFFKSAFPADERLVEVTFYHFLSTCVNFDEFRRVLARVEGKAHWNFVIISHLLALAINELDLQAKVPLFIQGLLKILRQHQTIIILCLSK